MIQRSVGIAAVAMAACCLAGATLCLVGVAVIMYAR
jgi:hypothetical protein